MSSVTSRAQAAGLDWAPHAMLRTVYHLLAEGTTYREPGADYYDRRHAERVRRRAIQLLERQGYRVILEPGCLSYRSAVIF
jgi:hypothetical protein